MRHCFDWAGLWRSRSDLIGSLSGRVGLTSRFASTTERRLALRRSQKSGKTPGSARKTFAAYPEAVTLVFTRLTDATCIRAVDIPAEKVKKLELPLNQATSITITPKKVGVEAFHCSAMGMGDGKLIVEN